MGWKREKWWLSATLTCLAATVADSRAEEFAPFPIGNHNPYLSVFGLPKPRAPELAPPGGVDQRYTLTLVNHADGETLQNEALLLDGESYLLHAVFTRRIAERFDVSLDIPIIAHRSGLLDNFLEDWHSFWGTTNSKRSGPSNQLRIRYERDQIRRHELSEGTVGFGDPRIDVRFQLAKATLNGLAATLRWQLKMPVGNVDKLHGSGAFDTAMSVDTRWRFSWLGRETAAIGSLGILVLGEGDILATQQRSSVPFATAGLAMRVGRGVELLLQLNAQGRYFDSDIEELGGTTRQFAFGATFTLPRSGARLNLGLVEDISADTTPDVAIQIGIVMGLP